MEKIGKENNATKPKLNSTEKLPKQETKQEQKPATEEKKVEPEKVLSNLNQAGIQNQLMVLIKTNLKTTTIKNTKNTNAKEETQKTKFQHNDKGIS